MQDEKLNNIRISYKLCLKDNFSLELHKVFQKLTINLVLFMKYEIYYK